MSFLKRYKDAGWLSVLVVAIVVAGFVIAYQFVGPPPPRELTVLAGSKGGAYHAFAARYAEEFARFDITLTVLETAGSVENLERISATEKAADFAFVQGGVTVADPAVELESLGSVYFEPVWVMHRAEAPMERLADLAGRRVAVGTPRSGLQTVARELLAVNGVTGGNARLVEATADEAAGLLESGEIDAAFFILQARAPLAERLLSNEDLRLLNFTRRPAYRSRLPYLSEVTLHEGITDLARDLPGEDVQLLAPAATLVVHPDMHPALIDLLMQVVARVHEDGGIYAPRGAFPSPEFTSFPLNDDARRFYRFGPPFFQRFMPFWVANLLDRLKVMLIPLLTLMIPLMKIAPPAYEWKIKSRIHKQYGRLISLEEKAARETDEARRRELMRDLRRIERDVEALKLPLSYSGQAYLLRQHVEYVRRHLAEPVEDA